MAIGGNAGIPPDTDIAAEPGPKSTYKLSNISINKNILSPKCNYNCSTCFCCAFCDSMKFARSVSNIIGANKIIELVKNIHDALQENW